MSLLAVWVQPFMQLQLISALGVGLGHGVDDGEHKIRNHRQKQVAKQSLESAGLLWAQLNKATDAQVMWTTVSNSYM